MSRVDLRRRIKALNQAMNPAGSLKAKLAKLTDDQQRAYWEWREQTKQFHRDHPDGEAYRLLIEEGELGPQLRPDVRKALFGSPTTIPANATNADAAEIYRRVLMGE